MSNTKSVCKALDEFEARHKMTCGLNDILNGIRDARKLSLDKQAPSDNANTNKSTTPCQSDTTENDMSNTKSATKKSLGAKFGAFEATHGIACGLSDIINDLRTIRHGDDVKQAPSDDTTTPTKKSHSMPFGDIEMHHRKLMAMRDELMSSRLSASPTRACGEVENVHGRVYGHHVFGLSGSEISGLLSTLTSKGSTSADLSAAYGKLVKLDTPLEAINDVLRATFEATTCPCVKRNLVWMLHVIKTLRSGVNAKMDDGGNPQFSMSTQDITEHLTTIINEDSTFLGLYGAYAALINKDTSLDAIEQAANGMINTEISLRNKRVLDTALHTVKAMRFNAENRNSKGQLKLVDGVTKCFIKSLGQGLETESVSSKSLAESAREDRDLLAISNMLKEVRLPKAWVGTSNADLTKSQLGPIENSHPYETLTACKKRIDEALGYAEEDMDSITVGISTCGNECTIEGLGMFSAEELRKEMNGYVVTDKQSAMEFGAMDHALTTMMGIQNESALRHAGEGYDNINEFLNANNCMVNPKANSDKQRANITKAIRTQCSDTMNSIMNGIAPDMSANELTQLLKLLGGKTKRELRAEHQAQVAKDKEEIVGVKANLEEVIMQLTDGANSYKNLEQLKAAMSMLVTK